MTDTLTHALTIHQPYAWAISAGHKPVENRTWRPPLEAVGKLIGIHAGQRQRPGAEIVARAQVKIAMGDPHAQPVRFTYGALIGVARLVGVVRQRKAHDAGGPYFEQMLGRSVAEWCSTYENDRIRPWWRGPWGWLLEEAVLLPEPIPMRGQQGLWRIPLRIGEIGTDSTVYVRPGDLALEQWRKARETR